MNPGWRDLVGHHVWASRELIGFCAGLDEDMLGATVPGTYGSVIATLGHMVDAELWYLARLTDAWSAQPWPDGVLVGADVLTERAAELAGVLERFVAGDWDDERAVEETNERGEVWADRAGVILTQLFHHANEHRAQVCTILGALGHEPPDVSAWGYAGATGRTWQQPASAES
jgi:uncharacterized damage-inducible protein DinB